MADTKTKPAGKYWILYFQPLPEAGERIAMALLFQEGRGGGVVRFDATFAKVLQVFPDADPQLLAFYLESLQKGLADMSVDVEAELNAYGPQIAASPARRIAAPLAEATVIMLMERYLLPVKRKRRAQEDGASSQIESFVRESLGIDTPVETQVTPNRILGHSLVGAKEVALAIRTVSGWALIDGVDLNQLKPQVANERVDEISRTFWRYQRAAAESGLQIQRVSVVLNGRSHLEKCTLDAHDYALHRFQVDSDLAIDAASTGAQQQLRTLVERLNDELGVSR